jgi:hypothetical protein
LPDISAVHVSPKRLPRLLGVLVMAFVETEAHGLYSALALLRGFAIQLSYRWGLGTVLADANDCAVLIWSPVRRGHAEVGWLRHAAALVAAVATGISLFLLSNLILLLPLGLLLRLLGVSGDTVGTVSVVVVSVRLLLTFVRACRAYRHDARLLACLPQPMTRRWRLDYVAAMPAGAGHGTRVLADFLRFADEHDAEVTLNCDADLVPYYRRHGFRRIDAPCQGQVLMLRQARSSRRGSPRRAVLQTVG